jgi:hypothetical protein
MITCKVLHLVSKRFPKGQGNIYVVSQLSRVAAGAAQHSKLLSYFFANQSLRFVAEV